MKIYAVIAIVFIQLIYIAVGDKELWYPNDGLPDPQTVTGARECGHSNGEPSSICDPNNLLQSDDIRQLEYIINGFSSSTRCFCSENVCKPGAGPKGAKISIAIVKEMMTVQEHKNGDKPKFDLSAKLQDAAMFAQYVSDDWNFDECNDGILIFYSAVDHVLYTHTGKSVAKNLTNNHIAEISMANRKHFNRGDYFEGFSGLIADYKSVLMGTYRPRVGEPAAPNVQYLIQEVPTASATSVTSMMTSIVASICMLAVALFLHF